MKATYAFDITAPNYIKHVIWQLREELGSNTRKNLNCPFLINGKSTQTELSINRDQKHFFIQNGTKIHTQNILLNRSRLYNLFHNIQNFGQDKSQNKSEKF